MDSFPLNILHPWCHGQTSLRVCPCSLWPLPDGRGSVACPPGGTEKRVRELISVILGTAFVEDPDKRWYPECVYIIHMPAAKTPLESGVIYLPIELSICLLINNQRDLVQLDPGGTVARIG